MKWIGCLCRSCFIRYLFSPLKVRSVRFLCIIYDTNDANIYKNLHSKIFVQIFEMGVVYEEEIAYISSRIRELRKEKKLTVQELAYRCDMERFNLSRIEAGRTNLTIRTICIICNALEVGLRDVIRA